MKREPLSVRYDKLMAIARRMAKEYDRLCESMRDYYGCEGCPLNVEGENGDGSGCTWYNDMYTPMCEMGVLDDDE